MEALNFLELNPGKDLLFFTEEALTDPSAAIYPSTFAEVFRKLAQAGFDFVFITEKQIPALDREMKHEWRAISTGFAECRRDTQGLIDRNTGQLYKKIDALRLFIPDDPITLSEGKKPAAFATLSDGDSDEDLLTTALFNGIAVLVGGNNCATAASHYVQTPKALLTGLQSLVNCLSPVPGLGLAMPAVIQSDNPRP